MIAPPTRNLRKNSGRTLNVETNMVLVGKKTVNKQKKNRKRKLKIRQVQTLYELRSTSMNLLKEKKMSMA